MKWLIALMMTVGFGSAATAPRQVSVAAASDLTEAFRVVGTQFEAATGIHPVFSFGSTAQLTRQIENGAPFDVIAGADTLHLEELERKGLLATGSRANYAIGTLALWVPPRSRAKIAKLEDLGGPDVRLIAMAKPELAPYGLAALETLRHAGLWEKVQPRVVYGENISAAKQYGLSGNADAVFMAFSLVTKEGGTVLTIGDEYHKPITQALGIVQASRNAEAALAFTEFLLRGKGREILATFGYRIPKRNDSR